MADCKTLRDALLHGMKFEITRQASRGQRRTVGAATVAEEQDPESITDLVKRLVKEHLATLQLPSLQRQPERRSHRPRCWNCGQQGHLRGQCRKPKPGVIPAIARRAVTVQASSLHSDDNSLLGDGRINGDSCRMSTDTRATQDATLVRPDARSCRPCFDNRRSCSRTEAKFGVLASVRQGKIQTTNTNTPAQQELRKAQEEDINIGPIVRWKSANGQRPGWQEVSPYSPSTKRYWAQWESLFLRDGVLYRRWESPDGSMFRWQLVVPDSRIKEVLREVHDSPSGGHFGINKTLEKVRERFYWAKCREDVQRWCRQCDSCASKKGPKTRSRGKMHTYNVGAPFERIALDIAGPFPRSRSENRFLLVIMDYFSKWPEVIPLPDQEAVTVAEALVNTWISRYGVPMLIHSDQGRNFDSAVFHEMCKLLGMEKTRTTPLHPQSDGMVERFNRTLTQHLSLFVSAHQQDWDEHLPLFLLSYRSAVHETTSTTPAVMLFGRDLRLPCDLLFGRPEEPHPSTDYGQELQTRMERIHHFARERIQLASERMKTRYDCRGSATLFKEGDRVWLHNPRRKKGLSPKFQKPWEGPYTVVNRINDVVYRIKRSPAAKCKVVHIDRLSQYHGPGNDQTGH